MKTDNKRCFRAHVGVCSAARLCIVSFLLFICLAAVLPRVARGDDVADNAAPATSFFGERDNATDQIISTNATDSGAPAAESIPTSAEGGEVYEAAAEVGARIENFVDGDALSEAASQNGDVDLAEPRGEAPEEVSAGSHENVVAEHFPELEQASRDHVLSEGTEERKEEAAALCDGTVLPPDDHLTECDDGTYSDAEAAAEGEEEGVTEGIAADALHYNEVEAAQLAHAHDDVPPTETPVTAFSEREDADKEEVTLFLEEAQSSFSEPAEGGGADTFEKKMDESLPVDEEALSSALGDATVDSGLPSHEAEQEEHISVAQTDPEAPSTAEPSETAAHDTPQFISAGASEAQSAAPPAPASPSEMVEPIAPHIYADVAPVATVDDDGDADAEEDRPSSAPAEEQTAWEEVATAAAAEPEEGSHAPTLAPELMSFSAEQDEEEEEEEDSPSALSSVSHATHPGVEETPPPRFPPSPPPPSRHALSYLYYHALEALYVEENTTLFVHRARDAAPYGHARLNWLLGVLHAYGVGVPQSERDAIMYYSFAAMEGVPEAHMALGYRYRNGIGVRASCEAALAHYREAADAVAMTYDGSAADLEGQAVTDTAGSRTLASGAGGRSGMLSFFTYRDNVATSDKVRQAQKELLSLIYQADTGSAQALLTLGYMYLKGNQQVRRDGRKAEGFLKQAAAKGVAEAHGALGNLYTAGDATIDPPLQRDLARACHHYRLGAAQRDAVSLNGIGFLHAIGYLEEGRVPAEQTGKEGEEAAHPPDFATAARYFEQSRSPESIYNLAVLHLYGRGVPRDRATAKRLFFNAAQGGSVLARWQLGHLLEESLEQNPEECVKALEQYKETASFGSWHRGDGAAASAALVSRFSAAAAAAAAEEGSTGRGSRSSSSETSDRGEATAATSPPQQQQRGDDPHDGPSAPRTSADYARLLSAMLLRLQSVEERLRLSDSDDGPVFVSLASFVELLSLAETGDAASTWLAAQYVEDYLEVEGEATDGVEDGAVTLLWPARTTTTTGSATAIAAHADFLAPKAARMSLLYLLLQRTVLHPRYKTRSHGDAYLRLGDLFYYGEAPQYGVDMARAMEYYRLAADSCHHAQALFNVGFMYQLGLHHAPRVTLVSSPNIAADSREQPGTIWKVHSNPPSYLTGAPSLFLASKAAAHAWNRDSTNAMSRGVDVYSAWRYYTESLRQEARGWMAVQFALLTLNVQWSLRHFGLHSLFAPIGSSASVLPFLSGQTPPPPVSPHGWTNQEGGTAETEASQAILATLTTVLHAEASFIYAVLSEVAVSLAGLYAQAEQVILYGAIGVFTLAMLLRHHAV